MSGSALWPALRLLHFRGGKNSRDITYYFLMEIIKRISLNLYVFNLTLYLPGENGQDFLISINIPHCRAGVGAAKESFILWTRIHILRADNMSPNSQSFILALLVAQFLLHKCQMKDIIHSIDMRLFGPISLDSTKS